MSYDNTSWLEKRAWVDCRRDSFEKQLDEKIEIVIKSLLPDNVKDAPGFLFCTLLNICKLDKAASHFIAKLFKSNSKDEETAIIEDFAAYLGAVNALFYSLRIGRGRPKVLALVSPWAIPSGYIHLLDLSPREICGLLSEAKQVHGVDAYKKAVIKMFEMPLPNITQEEKNSNTNTALQETLTTSKGILSSAMKIAGIAEAEREKANKTLNKFNSKIQKVFSALQDELLKAIPEYMQYESELRLSLHKIAPETAQNFFQISALYRNVQGVRKTSYVKLYQKEWAKLNSIALSRAKTTPEQVLSSYEANLEKGKVVKKYSHMNNVVEAYRQYVKSARAKDIIAEDLYAFIFEDIQTGRRNSETAISLAAKDLEIGESACLNHLKTAQRNRNLNKKWAERVLFPLFKT